MSNYEGSFGGHAMPGFSGDSVKATVKWFNGQKGFGFVAPEDGQGDAFLHISALGGAGLTSIEDGTEIMCTIAPGAKGRQVQQITEVLGVNPNFQSDSGRSSGGRSAGGFGGRESGGFGGRDSGGFGGGRDSGGFGRRDSYDSGETGDEESLSGTVKWFKQDKGFGFIAGNDGGPDVFVHKSLLRRCDIMVLDTGMTVDMRAKASPRGREATWLRVTG